MRNRRRGSQRKEFNPWQLSSALALGLATCGLAGLLAGCAATKAAPPKRYSGFLDDYSILEPRQGSDGAALSYVKPGAQLGRYEEVLIDPVVLYYGVGTPLHDVPRPDLETLANHLYAAMVRALEGDYVLVQRRGPDVLRVQVALTEAEASDVALNAVSSAMPIRPLSDLKWLTTGTQAFVGKAGIEARVVDAASGELLVAVVDRRQGAKRLDGAEGGWGDVLAAFDFWAARLQHALAEARERERGTDDR